MINLVGNQILTYHTKNKVFDYVDKISDFPKLGRIVPEMKNLNYRELLKGNYRIDILKFLL
jgi:uncharacterized protein YbgA (DUF1722 family)